MQPVNVRGAAAAEAEVVQADAALVEARGPVRLAAPLTLSTTCAIPLISIMVSLRSGPTTSRRSAGPESASSMAGAKGRGWPEDSTTAAG
jgi:hypothetical protein